jgi:hypothetical protein
MKNLIAIIEGNASNIDSLAKFVNNGRVDGVYFYHSDKRVSVCHPHNQLSEITQKDELDWFLKGIKYKIIKEEKVS